MKMSAARNCEEGSSVVRNKGLLAALKLPIEPRAVVIPLPLPFVPGTTTTPAPKTWRDRLNSLIACSQSPVSRSTIAPRRENIRAGMIVEEVVTVVVLEAADEEDGDEDEDELQRRATASSVACSHASMNAFRRTS